MLRVEAVSKSFGAVVALQDVSMALASGEVTGLVGDNGAGKSTLVKIISGVLRPDTGSVEFEGAPVNFASPAEARAHGIETVYQDLALVGNLTVWANVYLGRELTRRQTGEHGAGGRRRHSPVASARMPSMGACIKSHEMISPRAFAARPALTMSRTSAGVMSTTPG